MDNKISGSAILLTVVIPTKSSGKFIGGCLESLFDQIRQSDLKDLVEVIVVDDSSTDATLDIAKTYPVQILENGGSVGRSRNIGAKEAHGKYIVFTDSDCTFPDGWLSRILHKFSKSDVSILGGPDIMPPTSSIIMRGFGLVEGARLLAGAPSRSIDVAYRLRNCNMSVRKDDLFSVGGFDEKLRWGEDYDVALKFYRSGKKIVFDEGLRVFHYRRGNVVSYFWQNFWWGFAKIEILKLHDYIYALDLLLPLSIILNLIALVLLFYNPFFLIICVVLDLLALIVNTIMVGRKYGRSLELLFVPIATAIKVTGLGFGFLYGCFRLLGRKMSH